MDGISGSVSPQDETRALGLRPCAIHVCYSESGYLMQVVETRSSYTGKASIQR